MRPSPIARLFLSILTFFPPCSLWCTIVYEREHGKEDLVVHHTFKTKEDAPTALSFSPPPFLSLCVLALTGREATNAGNGAKRQHNVRCDHSSATRLLTHMSMHILSHLLHCMLIEHTCNPSLTRPLPWCCPLLRHVAGIVIKGSRSSIERRGET